MKFFAGLIVLAAIACVATADKHDKKEGLVGSSYGAPAGYGAAPVAAPPCPKSYLFSCQPNMAPVPCAAGGISGGYGGAGAYSEQVPQWVVPQWAAGVPQY